MADKLYKAFGKSVTGASHKRSGLPNQDAIGWSEGDSSGQPLVLAVSDGHGSHRCFRSDRGAKFAVEAALALVKEDMIELTSDVIKSRSAVVEERIPKLLTAHWLKRVEIDRDEHPFTETELDGVKQKGDTKDLASINNNPALAYGATLLAVIVGIDVILYLQIGDGDILTVADNSDGTDEGFLKIGSDYLNLIKSMGPEGVEKNSKIGLNDQPSQAAATTLHWGLSTDRKRQAHEL
ncbi:MAG: protein phosphatase 2C domain-containing protein [Nitrospirae bacterium]|nr:protein phosphatase 2C domain-containing protein [Nitrospirota bacterium]MBF0591852.1 protein phosphatase 2C domain-containing protein [Nitrospirota bacterium]